MVTQKCSPELSNAKSGIVKAGCEEGEIMKLP